MDANGVDQARNFDGPKREDLASRFRVTGRPSGCGYSNVPVGIFQSPLVTVPLASMNFHASVL
jgi:hypothetical protein